MFLMPGWKELRTPPHTYMVPSHTMDTFTLPFPEVLFVALLRS